ncbi:MAG: hypothetical protein ACT4O4_02875 [Nitrospiraceae bacterium]
MWPRFTRGSRLSVLLILVLSASVGRPDHRATAGDAPSSQAEFSGHLVKNVNGKKRQAQVFAKGDRLRLEYKYAVRTDVGYAAIEIIRMDQAEIWYVLAQRRELLVVPLDPDDALPVRPELPGESSRTFVGDAMVAGRAATLFDVQINRHGRGERFYEWIDVESGVVLKLVSRDRDWAFEYERFRLSPQPDYYFDAPPGYKKRVSASGPQRQG